MYNIKIFLNYNKNALSRVVHGLNLNFTLTKVWYKLGYESINWKLRCLNEFSWPTTRLGHLICHLKQCLLISTSLKLTFDHPTWRHHTITWRHHVVSFGYTLSKLQCIIFLSRLVSKLLAKTGCRQSAAEDSNRCQN